MAGSGRVGGCVVALLERQRRSLGSQDAAFPPDVIMVSVRRYLRYGLSYRDVEELLAERGIEVDHVTIYRWVQRFTPLLIDAARPCRHVVGNRWFVDETYVKVAGRWVYMYWAIDQYGQVIDVLVAPKRDLATTRRFFTRALKARLRPMRGLKRLRSARVISTGHAFVQNLRREPMPRVDIDSEFVVAAAQVLDERMPCADYSR